MSDKPPPPRGPSSLPPKYDYEGHSTLPAVNSSTVSTVTNSILTAYKINPVMVSMLLLLLTILSAAGWYMIRKDDQIYSYIALRDNRERDLNDRLIEMALKCRDLPTDKTAYPHPKLPNLSTGEDAFETVPTPPRRDTR